MNGEGIKWMGALVDKDFISLSLSLSLVCVCLCVCVSVCLCINFESYEHGAWAG